ncbi:MAG: hypothetical protein ACREJB_06405 [Planctomycetaceae bacterium]
MATAQRTKASEKQSLSKKLVALLKKRYKTPVPAHNRPVLQTLLYAVCLENASYEQADTAYDRLRGHFEELSEIRLNEVRVSSITELMHAFQSLPAPEMRALRVRSILQYVFEDHYQFEFETLRKKTLEAATRQLQKIQGLSQFVQDHTLQAGLGSHVVPIDDAMGRACVWLGLAEPHATPTQISESLKPALRKADAPLFCHLLRCLATDPRLSDAFDPKLHPPPEEGHDPDTAAERLTALLTQAKSAKAGRKRKTDDKSPPREKKSARNAAARNRSSRKGTGTASRR